MYCRDTVKAMLAVIDRVLEGTRASLAREGWMFCEHVRSLLQPFTLKFVDRTWMKEGYFLFNYGWWGFSTSWLEQLGDSREEKLLITQCPRLVATYTT